MRLFITILFCFQVAGIAASSDKSCVYQVKTRIVQSGGSVIIPCSYISPKKNGEDEQIRVRWLVGNETTCQNTREVIFPLSEQSKKKYKGRLNTRIDPNRNRTHYIEITGLQSSDGPLFCCKIFNNKNDLTNLHGTLLQFSDKVVATQLDELIAVSGEDIIIPCHYPKPIGNSALKVTWYRVQSNFQICNTQGKEVYTSDNPSEYKRYSLVNYPHNISLRIQNTNNEDQGGYCCDITTSKTLSKQITTLLVADQPSINIRNSPKINVQEGDSVNLTCSYSPPDQYTERDVLRVNVYWRVGNVTGPYAYHPYQEMVYSSYIKRTNITGTANLQIKGVKTEDDTTFHCFVVLKVCKDDDQYEDTIVYGGETRLIVRGTHVNGGIPEYEKGPNEGTLPYEEFPTYLIVIILFSVIFMIIIILILIVLKVKGAICERKENICEQQLNTIHAPGNGTRSCETGSKKPDEVPVVGIDNLGRKVEDEGDDKLLYAKLNEAKLNDKSRAQRPKHSEEVVYADVVNTAHK